MSYWNQLRKETQNKPVEVNVTSESKNNVPIKDSVGVVPQQTLFEVKKKKLGT